MLVAVTLPRSSEASMAAVRSGKRRAERQAARNRPGGRRREEAQIDVGRGAVEGGAVDVVARGGDRGDAALRGLGDGADGGAGGDRMGTIAGGDLEFADEAAAVLRAEYGHDDGNAEVGGLVEEAEAHTGGGDLRREAVDDGVTEDVGGDGSSERGVFGDEAPQGRGIALDQFAEGVEHGLVDAVSRREAVGVLAHALELGALAFHVDDVEREPARGAGEEVDALDIQVMGWVVSNAVP